MEHPHLTKAAAPDIASQHSVRPESNHAPQPLHSLLKAVGNSRLGSTIQAKFHIHLSSGRIVPFTVEAAYRLAQPLTPDAERIHSLMLNVGSIF